jgi:uncharacterized LabA/DUF88 family protein
MGKAKERQKVVVVIDYDNFASQCRHKRIDLDWGKLKRRTRELGRVVYAAVFTDVRQLPPGVDVEMMRAGFTVVHVPKLQTANTSYLKDMVDASITQVMSAVAHMDGIASTFVIASADRDFIAPINALRDAGKFVYVMTPTRYENPELRRAADGRVIYHKEAESATDERRRVIRAITSGEFDTDGGQPERVYLKSLIVLIRMMHSELGINNGNYSFRSLVVRLLECGAADRMDLGKQPDEAIKQRLELLSEADILLTEPRDERFLRYRLDLGHELVVHACDLSQKPEAAGAWPPVPIVNQDLRQSAS